MATSELTELVIMPGQDYKAICDSVRAKTGSTALLKSDEVSPAIDSIEKGIDISSDTPAEEEDIVKDKVAFVNGKKVIGSMESVGMFGHWQMANDNGVAISEEDDGTKSLFIIGTTTNTSTVYTNPGTTVLTQVLEDHPLMSEFGDATEDDVVEGKTFTSLNGFRVYGKHVCKEGIDTSTDTPAEEGDIVKGKVAFVNGEKVTGEMKAMSGLSALTEANEDSSVMSNDDGSKSLLLSGKYSGTTTRYVEPGTSLYIFMEDANDKMSMFGNATSEDVVKGKTFTSANGLNIPGSLPVVSSFDLTHIDAFASGTIIEGSLVVYVENDSDAIVRSGKSVYLKVPLSSAYFGNATEDEVLAGRTFTSANGVKITGKASLGASIPEEAVVIQKVMSAQASTQVGSGYSLSLTYGDELIINDDVILAFSGTTSTLRNITESTDFSVLSNKYIRTGSTMGTSTNTFYYIPPDAIFTVGGAAYNKTLTCDKAQKVTIQKVNL